MKTTRSFASYSGVFHFCTFGVSVLILLANGAVAATKDDDKGDGQIIRFKEAAENHFLRRNTVTYCGCATCTPTIWNTLAGQYSCGARISWLMSGDGGSLSEYDACTRVAGEEFGNGPCGPHCNPNVCASPPPTPKPTHSEITSPTVKTFCGCNSCTSVTWNTLAGQYTCGARISWLMSSEGGGHSEHDACVIVAGVEFPDGTCGPQCNPNLCHETHMPTSKPSENPTPAPTTKPTSSPTPKPTSNPTNLPTKNPTPAPVEQTFCGCPSCTSTIWDALAGQYTCGDRISWLMSGDGGSLSEYDACRRVAGEEFGNGPCGPQCNPEVCNAPPPTPTLKPSRSEISPPTPKIFCSCAECTTEIWDSPATDSAGHSYTCGQRISWLMTVDGGSLSERDACIHVAGVEFASGPCGPKCNPYDCDPDYLDDPDPATLVWSDEFDVDGSPDPSKWDYDLGDGCDINLCGWGNNEQEYYTNTPNNVKIENGVLRISAKLTTGYPQPYTSTRMITRGKMSFKYGRIRFRARLAGCTAIGTWPALWLLSTNWAYGGWPNSGELDVMETVGHAPDMFFGTIHTLRTIQSSPKGSHLSKSKSEWHIFEMDWQEDKIRMAIDKQVYLQYDKDPGMTWKEWPFDQEFHILMNVAVGGNWGGQQGVDSTAFEGDGQFMEIDWVRLYR